MYAAFSAGFSLIFGVMGVLNIAHGELIMLGAFSTFWLFQLWGLDPFLSLPISFALIFILGYLLQRFIINRVVDEPPIMSYILTFGLHLAIASLALLAWTADPRAVTTSYSGARPENGPIEHSPGAGGHLFAGPGRHRRPSPAFEKDPPGQGHSGHGPGLDHGSPYGHQGFARSIP